MDLLGLFSCFIYIILSILLMLVILNSNDTENSSTKCKKGSDICMVIIVKIFIYFFSVSV